MKLISNPKIDVTNETILNINEKHHLVCGMMIEYMVFFIKKPDNQATIRFGNLYFNFNHFFFFVACLLPLSVSPQTIDWSRLWRHRQRQGNFIFSPNHKSEFLLFGHELEHQVELFSLPYYYQIPLDELYD
jgi:hypothetical protein